MKHSFDESALICVFDRFNFGYLVILFVLFAYIPCAVIGLSYIRIFYHTYNIKKKIFTNNSNQKNKNKKNRVNADSIKLAKNLFSSFFVYFFVW